MITSFDRSQYKSSGLLIEEMIVEPDLNGKVNIVV